MSTLPGLQPIRPQRWRGLRLNLIQKETMATATESSKKLLAPIKAAGAAMLWGNLHF